MDDDLIRSILDGSSPLGISSSGLVVPLQSYLVPSKAVASRPTIPLDTTKESHEAVGVLRYVHERMTADAYLAPDPAHEYMEGRRREAALLMSLWDRETLIGALLTLVLATDKEEHLNELIEEYSAYLSGLPGQQQRDLTKQSNELELGVSLLASPC